MAVIGVEHELDVCYHAGLNGEEKVHRVYVPVDRREVVHARQVLFESVLERRAGKDERDNKVQPVYVVRGGGVRESFGEIDYIKITLGFH